jgi:hypothetical protein
VCVLISTKRLSNLSFADDVKEGELRKSCDALELEGHIDNALWLARA